MAKREAPSFVETYKYTCNIVGLETIFLGDCVRSAAASMYVCIGGGGGVYVASLVGLILRRLFLKQTILCRLCYGLSAL